MKALLLAAMLVVASVGCSTRSGVELAGALPAPVRMGSRTNVVLTWDNPTTFADGTSIPSNMVGYTKIAASLTNVVDWTVAPLIPWPATAGSIAVSGGVWQIRALAGVVDAGLTNESGWTLPIVWTNAARIPFAPADLVVDISTNLTEVWAEFFRVRLEPVAP